MMTKCCEQESGLRLKAQGYTCMSNSQHIFFSEMNINNCVMSKTLSFFDFSDVLENNFANVSDMMASFHMNETSLIK
jgi:hypothetical protein